MKSEKVCYGFGRGTGVQGVCSSSVQPWLWPSFICTPRASGSCRQSRRRTVHLAFVLALTFLMFPFKSKGGEETARAEEHRPLTLVDLLLVALSFALGMYVMVEDEALSLPHRRAFFP